MKIEKMLKSLLLVATLSMPNLLNAEEFTANGLIESILIDDVKYGQCMISLKEEIGNGCTSKWATLDCNAVHSRKGTGDRMLNIALIAQSLKKKVTIYVNDNKKVSGYCVVSRVVIRR